MTFELKDVLMILFFCGNLGWLVLTFIIKGFRGQVKELNNHLSDLTTAITKLDTCIKGIDDRIIRLEDWKDEQAKG